MRAPLHAVRNTVEQLLRKTLNFICPELWPQQAALGRLQDLGSLQKREYGLRVNKIEVIKQQLVEIWKNSYAAFE